MQKLFFVLLLIVCSLESIASESKLQLKVQQFSDLTIIVTSCDRYAELWDPFFTLLFKHWPSLLSDNKDLPIFLIANQKRYPDSRVQTINIAHEKGWSDNMRQVLQHVRTKYVMIVLDDYMLNAPVNEKRLKEMLGVLRKEKGAYIQIAYINTQTQKIKPYNPELDIAYKPRFTLWRTSLQACIWETQQMIFMLNPKESHWQFEIEGSIRSDGLDVPFFVVERNFPLSYLNAVQEGHINNDVVRYLYEQGIPYTRQEFKSQTEYKIKQFIKSIKQFVKRAWGAL